MSAQTSTEQSHEDPSQIYDVVVMGTGFSGLCAAIKLKLAGHENFVVLEKESNVGGTWWVNRYPGVECDVPSHLYSFSFDLNPHWSKSYAPGAEIQAYLRASAAKFGVLDHVRFGTRVLGARWTGTAWEVRAEDGRTFQGRHLVSGLGGLHIPNIPMIPGLDSYSGPLFHTAQWPDGLDLSGRRIGVIGTGATAVQAAPVLADSAGALYLFQRHPIWVLPKRDEPYSRQAQTQFELDDHALRAHRWGFWRQFESTGVAAMREGTDLNRAMERVARRTILNTVDDPAVAEKLIPDFNVTCKRPTYSARYYPMFNRSNVTLVTAGIRAVNRVGIETEDETVPLDAIVLATGFKPFNIAVELDIIGLDGVTLKQAWSGRVTTYKTVMAHGFPNLYFLLGPNSAGLTSAVQMIEAAADFVLDAVEYVNSSGIDGIHPDAAEVAKFTEFIDRATATTTVSHGCTSWWTEGGVNHTLWPLSSIEYREMLRPLEPSHFATLDEAAVI